MERICFFLNGEFMERSCCNLFVKGLGVGDVRSFEFGNGDNVWLSGFKVGEVMVVMVGMVL